MKVMNRRLGFEIIVVQIAHGLLGAVALGLIAANVPWWLLLALLPLILFSLAYWLMEASFILPVARRLLQGGKPTNLKPDEAARRPIDSPTASVGQNSQ